MVFIISKQYFTIHGLYDCLEIHQSQELHFTNTGLEIDAPIEKTYVYEHGMDKRSHPIPPIAIHLHNIFLLEQD